MQSREIGFVDFTLAQEEKETKIPQNPFTI